MIDQQSTLQVCRLPLISRQLKGILSFICPRTPLPSGRPCWSIPSRGCKSGFADRGRYGGMPYGNLVQTGDRLLMVADADDFEAVWEAMADKGDLIWMSIYRNPVRGKRRSTHRSKR